jgi:hypothetical protein
LGKPLYRITILRIIQKASRRITCAETPAAGIFAWTRLSQKSAFGEISFARPAAAESGTRLKIELLSQRLFQN